MKEDISTRSWTNWRSKTRRNIKTWCEWVMPIFNEYWATSHRITRKQVLGGNEVVSPKKRLALTIGHTQNCLALLPSFHPWWPWLRLLSCAWSWSTMLKERGKCFQLRFNIPNILENKRNVEWMLKQSLRAFKFFQHRFNIVSSRFNNVERGWQTLSTWPFNKIERMLKQMLKPFARALIQWRWLIIKDFL